MQVSSVKKCGTCQESLDVSRFGKDRRNNDGLFGSCKNCEGIRVKSWAKAHPEAIVEIRKNRYNIDFKALWEAQKGLCGLCHEPMLPSGQKTESVVVDHDHNCCPGRMGSACGKCVRGLLHNDCNRLLGILEKKSHLIKGAEEYLARWRKPS